MADSTLLFDELLQAQGLRAKSYVVLEPANTGLACVELTARRQADWFFARRWIPIRQGRRLLYWILDQIEGEGFRFRITQAPRPAGGAQAPSPEPWTLASVNWANLSEEERRIHRELFPQEDELLRQGYDWDHSQVYRDGVALAHDPHGRVVEQVGAVVHEWVRIVDEWTWRRYPLYVVPATVAAGASASSDASSAALPCT